MGSSDIEIRSCVPPEGEHIVDESMWWEARIDGELVGRLGAYEWTYDCALCIVEDELNRVQLVNVVTALVEEIVGFGESAGYNGVYAVTCAKDKVLPVVLDNLAFAQVEKGREWSNNPTTIWYREEI